MKKLLLALTLAAVLPSLAFSAQLTRFQPGKALQDGSQLNQSVDALNSGLTCASYIQKVAAASIVDETFFVASRAMRVATVSATFSVTNGGTLTAQLSKDTGTTAPGAGTDLLSTAFNLNATANTVQVGALVGTAGVVNLAAGDRLAIDFSAAGTNLVGAIITACMAPN